MNGGVQLVVARYREDVSWVPQLDLPAVVYDKSGQGLPGSMPVPGVVPLPNIGREAHTYFTHIVREYDRLAEVTVFLQGDPFFHLRQDGRAGAADLKTMLGQAVADKAPFRGLAWFRLKCDGLGRPHDMHLPENKGKWAGWGKDIPVAQTFSKLFAAPPPQSYVCRGVTGNFLVRAERIRIRPRTFYRQCLDMVENDPYDEMNTGHAVERLWHLIFNGNAAWNRSAPAAGKAE